MANGNIFLEAKSDASFEELANRISKIISTVFGDSASLRPMIRPTSSPVKKTAIVRNVPSSYNTDDVLTQLQIAYPTATKVYDLRKPGKQTFYRSVRVVLTDDSEWRELLTYGFRIGWECFKAEEWLPFPTQCFNCQRYGHRASVCRSAKRCINCSEAHEPSKHCEKPTVCANCKGDHMAKRNFPRRSSALNDLRETHSNFNTHA